ncbi:MAG: hypothetical protein LBU18_01885 [Treponema sp.]|nr:hypothetical protein [Treponema sp.]
MQKKRFGEKLKVIISGAWYGSEENYVCLEQQGIQAIFITVNSESLRGMRDTCPWVQFEANVPDKQSKIDLTGTIICKILRVQKIFKNNISNKDGQHKLYYIDSPVFYFKSADFNKFLLKYYVNY